MKNWLEYIENVLSGIDFEGIETNKTDYYLWRLYRHNGTYLSFDLIDNQKKIRKIEIGKYWSTNKDVSGYEISSSKGVFDKTKEHLIDFIQVSFDNECGEQFELDFSDKNKKVLKQFLTIPLYNGWTERYYKFKDDNYKIMISLDFESEHLNFEIILLHFAEQDLPMLGDKTEKKIRAWWADLKINDNEREIEKEIIKPIKT